MTIEILRPSAAGDECNIEGESASACPNHYQNVDEVESDGTTSYIYTSGTWQRDLYNIEDHSEGSGTINSVKVYTICSTDTYTHSQTDLKIVIKSGTGTGAPDTVDESAEKTISAVLLAWSSDDNTWNTNPATTAAWTWDEIDKLQIGLNLREPRDGRNNISFCTQVYVEIDYTAGGGATEQAVGEGAITPSATLNLKISIDIGDGAITPTGALGAILRFLQGTGDGTITPTGTLGKVLRFFKNTGTGVITPIGTLGLKIARAVGSGVITPVGTLGRKILLAIGSGAITPAGILGRKIARGVGSGVITPIGALATNLLAIFTQVVGSGVITPVGTLATNLLGMFFQAVGSGIIKPIGTLTTLVERCISIGVTATRLAMTRLFISRLDIVRLKISRLPLCRRIWRIP